MSNEFPIDYFSSFQEFDRWRRWKNKDITKRPPGFREIEDTYLGLPVPDDFRVAVQVTFCGFRTAHTATMQGIEFLLHCATNEAFQTPRTELVQQAMDLYATAYDELHQFPELWAITKQTLLDLPRGEEVVAIITSTPEYHLS